MATFELPLGPDDTSIIRRPSTPLQANPPFTKGNDMPKITAAIYVRKSTDQGDRDESVKSVSAQREAAEAFIQKQGWTAGPVFSDDGISGAVFVQRPGLQQLLGALKPPAFQRLVVESQSRLGRDTLKTMLVLTDIEKSGVEVWCVNDGTRLTLKDADSRLITMIKSEIDAREREKTSPLVRSRAHQRHANGFVVGGKVYGYKNQRTCGGCIKGGVGTCRHPSVRVVDEEQAAVIRRIFEMTRDGLGLAKVRGKLNAEKIAGPRGAWAITGVREILHRRDYKGDIITNRHQRARDDEGNAIRVEQPEEAWLVRKDESLRVVSDELWDAAHARVAQTVKSYLRRGRQLVGKVESTKGLYLLSGFCTCGICGKPLIATRRGRDLNLVYFCREHKERGDGGCPNATGVPAMELHDAVISAMRKTFTPEAFTAHLAQQAGNVAAREQRAAERQNLIAELPKMAAAEQRLVKRIGTVEDDGLVAALKSEWSDAKAAREWAERRLGELEGIERDLASDRAEVEQLRETWQSWSDTLQVAVDAAPGSVPAEAHQQARQILKKVLTGPIKVTPWGQKVLDEDGRLRGAWAFEGYSRYEGLLSGGLLRGVALVVQHDDHREETVRMTKTTWRPIAGGSDDESSTGRDTDMAPHTPHYAQGVPAEP